MSLQPGVKLRRDEYRIISELGYGGFGITYLAENIMLEKRVAIKEFFPSGYCERDINGNVFVSAQSNRELIDRLRHRFVKEAQNIARLHNPHIVAIHDIFEQNGTAYYVMDYIDGETLSEIVKREGPLPEYKAVEYIEKIGGALSYIHGRKMTHFDVKPANIMIRRDTGEPILIDFGLSKQFDGHGDANSAIFNAVSPGFSALELYNPELIKKFTPHPDIYSLGATFYYLLTGLIPPNANTIFEEGLIIPDLAPLKYHDILWISMSPARKHRYATVADMVKAIKAAQAQVGYPQPQPEDYAGIGSSTGGYSENIPTPPPLKTRPSDAGKGYEAPVQPPVEPPVETPYEPSYEPGVGPPMEQPKKGYGLLIGILVGVVVAAVLAVVVLMSLWPDNRGYDFQEIYMDSTVPVTDTVAIESAAADQPLSATAPDPKKSRKKKQERKDNIDDDGSSHDYSRPNPETQGAEQIKQQIKKKLQNLNNNNN